MKPRALKFSPVCERGFAIFLLAWGVVLALDAWLPYGGSHGIFYGHFTAVMPSAGWAAVMIALGAAKIVAYKRASRRWRVKLSALTVALFAAIASLAVYALMVSAVGPLAAFVAVVAWWCHVNLVAQVALESAVDA